MFDDLPRPFNRIDTPGDLGEYNIQFDYYYSNEYTSLREIEYQETMEATVNFRNKIIEERPLVVLLVGNHMSQFQFDRDTTPGLKEAVGVSQIYSLPSTSILNTRYSTERLQNLFDDFAEFYENLII
ncbi:hypothetical protein INT48_000027 [Thamnidium elegans]|nr:hypothetical protein INT48_000027 [Thamnidium elegans]